MKTRKEILAQPYVNISDIRCLLQLPKDKARALYMEVDELESQKPFRPHDKKVLLQNVLKMAGISFSFIEKQIGEKND